MVFITVGWTISFVSRPTEAPANAFSDKAQWSGEVTDIRTTPGAARLTVDIHYENNVAATTFKCAVLIPNPLEKYEPGDCVKFTAKLFNPAETSDLPDENSYNPKYFTDGITAQANVAPDNIEVIGSYPTLRRTAMRWQADLRDLIYRSPVSSQTAWFLAATLLGDDSMLDPNVKQQFRATGAAHYLALSGFHIGIIAMLASIAFFPLKLMGRFGRLRHIGVIFLIWLYAFICGMSPSLVRAAVLISVFLLAKVLQRQSSPYNSLCVAAICILTFAPRQLFAPGFQLSFCAVLAILVFAPRFNPFRNQGSRAYRIAEFFTVPLAAMLGTCLITIVHFHRLPIIFLIPNLILAVLLPLLLSAGIIIMITTAIGLRLSLLGAFIDMIYTAVTALCDKLAHLPCAELTGIFLPPLTVISGSIAIILLAYAITVRRRLYFTLSLAFFLCSTLVYILRPQLPDSELYITRQPLRTDIVVRERDSTFIITTAPERNWTAVTSSLSRRYANFLARRSCSDSLTVNNSDFTLPTIRRRDNYIIFGDKTLFIASSANVNTATIQPHYLLITRQSGRDPFSIVNRIMPDTVIIARDTPQLRASRLLDSCHLHSIPAIHLTDRPFRIINKN